MAVLTRSPVRSRRQLLRLTDLLPTDNRYEGPDRTGRAEVGMAGRAEAVYLDEMGNIVPREKARRVRITLMDAEGRPMREIWGVVSRPEDPPEWLPLDADYELLI
jgi:hypothetical protein